MVSDRIERSLTVVLAGSALVLAASVVRRELMPTRSQRAPAVAAAYQPDWQEAFRVGVRSGDSAAPISLVVFSDFECPACASLHKSLREALRVHSHEVSTILVHFPLTKHRFALQAARAAECAAARGRLGQFEDVVYDKQDSLGIKSWGAYALEAGIADTSAIAACARDPREIERIRAGRALGMRWQIRGTPTVFINGKRYDVPPTSADIDEAIRQAAAR